MLRGMREIFFVSVILVAGCSEPAPTTFSGINAQIFQRSCANFSSCHSNAGANSAGGLNMETNTYANLVGKLSNNAMAKAEGKLLVKPGDPEASFLIHKMTLPNATSPRVAGKCTEFCDRMPQGNPPLPSEQIEGIKTWILNGALND
jgi:hypothetical protein